MIRDGAFIRVNQNQLATARLDPSSDESVITNAVAIRTLGSQLKKQVTELPRTAIRDLVRQRQ